MESHGAFNLIHLEAMQKIDVFVAGPARMDREQLRRRRRIVVSEPGNAVWVTAPEDIVLRKLFWFKLGSGASDRQWRDVLGVLKEQGERLDLPYLRESAEAAGLADLLRRAFAETGKPELPDGH